MKSRLWMVVAFIPLFALVCARLSAADTTPPQLVSLSLSPTTVDTLMADQTIAVTVRVTDDLSGLAMPYVGNVQVTFISPSKTQRTGVGFYAVNRQSGSATDGIYTNSLILPRYSEPGVWAVDSATARDAVGNQKTLGLGDFLVAGLPAQITVQGTGDVTPPQLASLSLSTATVDTSAADQIVTVRIQVTDDLSGFTSRGGGGVHFTSLSHTQRVSVSFNQMNRESGSATGGFYTNNLVLPRYSEPGVWTVEQASFQDAAGNQRRLFLSDFLAASLPTQITVLGNGDTTPPQLVSVSVSGTTVDTSLVNQTVKVTLRLADDLSGFTGSTGPFSFYNGRASIFYFSPSRVQQSSVTVYTSNRESGSAVDGFYTNNLVLPRYCEPGLWTVSSAEVYDAAGNVKTFVLSDFLAAGWPAQILVTEQPTVRLFRSGEAVLVSWPANADGFVLQSKSSLDSEVAWTNVPGAPVLLGQDRILSLPAREGAAFFRLLKPSP